MPGNPGNAGVGGVSVFAPLAGRSEKRPSSSPHTRNQTVPARPICQSWPATPWNAFQASSAYVTDMARRSVLFRDTIRRRGNECLDHERAGEPPVFAYDYEKIVEGRTLERPVNARCPGLSCSCPFVVRQKNATSKLRFPFAQSRPSRAAGSFV